MLVLGKYRELSRVIMPYAKLTQITRNDLDELGGKSEPGEEGDPMPLG